MGWAAGQSASDVLRQTLFHAIDIDDDFYAYLMSLASGSGETANAILRRELDIHANPAPADPPPRRTSSFIFRPGQELGPWNTRDHAVMGVVGQTLRIYNDDNVTHRLHTDGVPFPHPGADIAPGTFSDFALHNVFDLDTNPGLYDHDFGQTARFWISVRPAA